MSTRGQKRGAAPPPPRPSPPLVQPRSPPGLGFSVREMDPRVVGCLPGVCEAALGRELSWCVTWSQRGRSDEMQTLRVRQGFVICLKLKVLEVSGLRVIETDVTEKNFLQLREILFPLTGKQSEALCERSALRAVKVISSQKA